MDMNIQANSGERIPRIIAVIDDDETNRWTFSEELEEWGYKPALFEGQYGQVEDLLREIKDREPDIIVCDNKLQAGGYANFYGATAAVRIHREFQIPSILVTKYQDSDEQLLKRWRPELPVILDKDDVNEDTLALSIAKCEQEVLDDNPFNDRRPHRSLVVVEDIRGNDVVAFVPAWNPEVAVNFPITLLGNDIRKHCQSGGFLFAQVNIGAIERRDLFFKNFEVAAEPRDDDGLT